MTTIYAGTSSGQIGELAELTIDEIRKSADQMTPAEVARARAQMKAGLLMGLESASSRAERLARMVAIWNRVPEIEETVAKIDAVTTGDVREFAGRLATEAPLALALYGPVGKAPEAGALKARLAA
jgi:predicted Zn-dependent peptidase